MFVADPLSAPVNTSVEYARPDDWADGDRTWRELLTEYNRERAGNPLGLCAAYQLYRHRVYERLVAEMGVERVYILSAGWGLVRADFLMPHYDITFSGSAASYQRRRRNDAYFDYQMLPNMPGEDVAYLGGTDYLGLFLKTTSGLGARRTVFYQSSRVPVAGGCDLRRFETRARTNWHYLCAQAILDGTEQLPGPAA
ncbi:MAG: hypothetical protein NTV52_28065 [Acidobacteria bacterium]|nr:hypothetical protein [Acidobacteriota bacterium]